MNKTVNINLAGIFFHIDEDAYLKLKAYLDTIRNSFKNGQEGQEILQDIEARIAELFTQKMAHEKQVIGINEVNEVISIMGQPEDYQVDEDFFEDKEQAYTSAKSKKLYRDTLTGNIAGICAGFGHYFDFSVIWLRIIFIILAIATSGTFILIYLILWLVIPEAKTTAEKLEMTGEPINISNIEKKVKEGFQHVSDRMKDVDYEKYKDQFTNSSTNFFRNVGNGLVAILTFLGKCLGFFLVVVSGLTLLSLILGFLFVSFSGIYENPFLFRNYGFTEIFIGNDTIIPNLVTGIALTLFMVIPVFIIFYLGLKLLITNLNSIGKTAKITLLALWLVSLGILSYVVMNRVAHNAYEEEIVSTEVLPIMTNDTLTIKPYYDKSSGFSLNESYRYTYKKGGENVFQKKIRLKVLPTHDSIGKIVTRKKASGKSSLKAQENAEEIDHEYALNGNLLNFNGIMSSPGKGDIYEENLILEVYLPINSYVYLHEDTSYFAYCCNNLLSDSTYGEVIKIEDKAKVTSEKNKDTLLIEIEGDSIL
ncbi:PspC domain-containing protein [Mesonia sp. K7]|uniref:PspC domain-containing protein n=1 Tax=Mesonia sp. K7 TaxID=2218606 RepID=UPI000DA8D80E|nr:PspC domain-containing protein [Mesonia sp. K7]PZD77294.1 hypothetical protein DNG35_09490 [Mesonia sp. K7]